MRDLFREELETLAPHIQDWLQTEGKEFMSKQIIRVSDATFRAIAAQHGFVVTEPQAEKQYQSPLAVGDTVKIIGPQCKGLVGELKVIDEHNDDEGDFFGIAFDGVDGYVFFGADEIVKVEPVPQNCDKCGQKRKTLTNTGTEAYPVWKCGTCLHREARRINTREMYGKGRRGY